MVCFCVITGLIKSFVQRFSWETAPKKKRLKTLKWVQFEERDAHVTLSLLYFCF